jgi:hypothetical protein
MTAIVYGFVSSATRESDLAIMTVFSLTGVVLSLVLVHLGLDLGAAILD